MQKNVYFFLNLLYYSNVTSKKVIKYDIEGNEMFHGNEFQEQVS